MKKLSLLLALMLSATIALTACAKDENVNNGGDDSSSTSATDQNTVDDFALEPNRYVYNELGEDGQYLYKTIYNAVMNFEQEAVFDKEYDGELVIDVYESVYFQEPEIFWLRGEMKSNNVPLDRVNLTYWCSKEEMPKHKSEIEKSADDIMATIPEGADDFEKILTIHDNIAKKAHFQKNTDFDTTTLYGPLVTGPTQCEAYAKVMTYMLNKLDIQSIRMTGLNSKGLTHAWNKVLLNDKWYNLDLTWNDPDGNTDPEYFTHNYFMIPDSEIEHITHYPVISFTAPEADSLDMNYFVKKGLFAKTSDEAVKMLETLINEAAKNKAPAVQIKCETKEVYDAVLDIMKNQGKLLELVEKANAQSDNKITSPSNASDETLKIINFKLKY